MQIALNDNLPISIMLLLLYLSYFGSALVLSTEQLRLI